jgi:phosphohistidine phosphatase SixA
MNKQKRRLSGFFRTRVLTVGTLALLGFLIPVIPGSATDDEKDLWSAMRSGGYVVLMRHAIAPGTGDPPNFQLDDCNTQRNLSDEGREQAVRIGARFRENGILSALVFSSQWCRCLETAKLLDLGPVHELSILNSFFRQYELRDQQTRMLQEWLDKQQLDRPVVLVTHQVNISALTDVFATSGEMVIIRRFGTDRISVVGRISTN